MLKRMKSTTQQGSSTRNQFLFRKHSNFVLFLQNADKLWDVISELSRKKAKLSTAGKIH